MATGFGAAIVIIGAMFKIQHWPGASIALIGGLSVEAALFLMGAFEEPHMDIDWTLVYPELNTWATHDDDGEEAESFDAEDSAVMKEMGSGDPVSQKLDRLLQDANIGSDLIESLGAGMRNLSESAGNMNKLSDVAPATDKFVSSINNASSNVDTLSENYLKANKALEALVATEVQEGAGYAEELSKLSKNLSELNNVYEMQLTSTGEQMRVSADANEKIAALLQNLSDSVEDTKRYKEQVAELGNNLEQLNTVYGNMLSAMSINRG
jgi:gliding motility-associated protein GldL